MPGLEESMNQDDWRNGVNNRLREIENRMITVEQKSAVDEVHRVNVEKRLTAIEGNLSKLIWLVVAVIVGAVMKSVMDGNVML